MNCKCGNKLKYERVSQTFYCSSCDKYYDINMNETIKVRVINSLRLISCPACNHQVSNQAQSCPHCGQPINTKPKCPTCGSQDIKKISGTERGLSVWAWGAFSNKINKNWKCNKCGHTW